MPSPAIFEVDHPDFGNAVSRTERHLDAAIAALGRIGDFDDEQRIRSARIAATAAVRGEGRMVSILTNSRIS